MSAPSRIAKLTVAAVDEAGNLKDVSANILIYLLELYLFICNLFEASAC